MNNPSVRLQKEIEKLIKKPPPGITCFPMNDAYRKLKASVCGCSGTPYENGMFEIDIEIPSNYPFLPPRCLFKTKIYHPNIDDAGRICLDLLKVQPEGTWRPTCTVEGVLVALQFLMNQPNPDHPLMAQIANEYKFNRPEFNKKAEEWTLKYASNVDILMGKLVPFLSCD